MYGSVLCSFIALRGSGMVHARIGENLPQIVSGNGGWLTIQLQFTFCKEVLSMKKSGRVFAMLLVVSMMMVIMVVPALAANTTDEDFWYYSAPANGYTRIPGRQKTNSTSVYVNVSQSSNPYTRVRAYGQNSNGTSFENCTWYKGRIVDYVNCYREVHHSILSLINERGWGYASLGFRSGGTTTDTVSGWWSPDSGSSHQVATP